jgi:hypothetical protein
MSEPEKARPQPEVTGGCGVCHARLAAGHWQGHRGAMPVCSTTPARDARLVNPPSPSQQRRPLRIFSCIYHHPRLLQAETRALPAILQRLWPPWTALHYRATSAHLPPWSLLVRLPRGCGSLGKLARIHHQHSRPRPHTGWSSQRLQPCPLHRPQPRPMPLPWIRVWRASLPRDHPSVLDRS